MRVRGGGTCFFLNEHIAHLPQRVLGLSSPTFWSCIWLSRQQLIIIKPVGVLEQWRRGGRGSGKLPDQTPVLASRYLTGFHERGGGGGKEGTYVCVGGGVMSGRGDLDRPVANSHPHFRSLWTAVKCWLWWVPEHLDSLCLSGGDKRDPQQCLDLDLNFLRCTFTW